MKQSMEKGGCRMEELELEQNEQLLEQRRLRRLEQKRRRKMQQRMVLGLLALIVVLALVLIVRGCRAKPAPTPVEPSVPEEPVTTPTEPEADSVVQLTAVGDIMIYDDILAAAQTSEGVYDFSECFSAVAAYTMGADLTVGNLELNFCGAPYTGKPQPGAKTAVTLYKTLQSRNGLSLVECELITGRTHQIRAQMAAAGHPLLGDGKYGKLDKRYDRKFQALYSYSLRFCFTTDGGILSYLDGRSFRVEDVDFVHEYFP